MMYSVPSHIVQKVTDYAHRKAELYFRDYLEEFLMSSITENDAFHHYRNEFYEAIFNVLDGNDRNCDEIRSNRSFLSDGQNFWKPGF